MTRPLAYQVAVRLTIRKYPAELGTLEYRFSPRAIGDSGDFVGFGEPRVAIDGFGDIVRALSSLDGNYEVPTWSCRFLDEEGFFRGLLADPTTNGVDESRWEVMATLETEAGRNAEMEETVLFRGIVTAATPDVGRLFTIEAKSILGGHMKGFDLDANIPLWKLKDDFGDSPEYPEANNDAVASLVYGENSDHGTVDAQGNNIEKGLVRPVYTGKELISDGFPGTPPTAPTYLGQVTNLQVVVTGSGSTHKVAVGVSLTSHFGETPPTILVVDDYPLHTSGSHYATWTWDLPVANADQIVHAVEYVGDDMDKPRYFLDGDGGTGGPSTSYVDDGDDDHRKLWHHGPVTVNTAQVAPGDPGVPGSGPMYWDRWVVAAGVLPFRDGAVDFLGADLANAVNATAKRAKLNASVANAGIRNLWIIAPGDSLWPHPDPWLEVNDRRYTVFYSRGAISQQAINGVVGFALNIPGYTENPDATGRLLNQAGPVAQHLLSNWAGLDPDAPTYTNGATWNDVPLFANGDPKLKTSAFAQFQTDTATAMATELGAITRFVIDRPATLRTWMSQYVWTFYARWGDNHFGQLGPFRMPHGLSNTGTLHRDRIEIKGWLQPAFDRQTVTEVTTVFDFDSELQAMRRKPIRYQDDDAFARNNNRPKVRELIQMPLTGDPWTAEVSSRYWLALFVHARRFQPWDTTLRGQAKDLADPMRLTHYDGLGVTGDVNTQVLVDRTVFSYSRDTVTLTGLDLTQLEPPGIPALTELPLVADGLRWPLFAEGRMLPEAA